MLTAMDLRKLSKATLKAIANDDNTPKEVLITLANDEDEYVRKAVAENASAPEEALTILTSDENEHVRYAVAGLTLTFLKKILICYFRKLLNDILQLVH